MAQQQLQRAQVGAMVEQMGGETVAQPVWRHRARVDPGHGRMALEPRPERLPGRRPAPGGQEQRHVAAGVGWHRLASGQLRPGLGQVTLQPVPGLLPQRHQPILAALAGHPHHPLAQVDRIGRQVHQLAHPQAGGVHQFQHRPVAQAFGRARVRRGQQGLDLGFAQRLGQRPRQPRRVEQCRRIVVAHAQPDQVGIEGTQAGAQARVAARLVAMPGAPAQVVEQAGTVDALQPAAGTVAPARQLFQIAPIGVLGLPRQPVLGPGRFDEARNRPRIGIAQRRQRMGQAAAVGGGQSSGRHGAQDSRRLPVSCAAMNAPPLPDPAAHAAPDTATPPRPRALVGWRLLSLFYDLWPMAALWMLVAVPFVALDAFIAGDVRHNIAPGSLLSQLQFLCSLAVTGGYATLSWRRGGQTLGMRPWRLKLVTADGGTAGWKALWLRYLVGLLSLAAGGLGFWWAWIDRDRRTWHDRASGTHLVRLPKP